MLRSDGITSCVLVRVCFKPLVLVWTLQCRGCLRATRLPAVMSLDAASDAQPSEIGDVEEIEMKGNASFEAAQQKADGANCVGNVPERVGNVSGVALEASTGGTESRLLHSVPFGVNDTEIDDEDALVQVNSSCKKRKQQQRKSSVECVSAIGVSVCA